MLVWSYDVVVCSVLLLIVTIVELFFFVGSVRYFVGKSTLLWLVRSVYTCLLSFVVMRTRFKFCVEVILAKI